MRKHSTTIQSGGHYFCSKIGEVITAIQQVAVVKSLAMWEVELQSGTGIRKRAIVSARTLSPLPA
jgi:hypothetical protein